MPQKLSPGARKRKAARDLAYAKGERWNGKSTARFKRKEKKAEKFYFTSIPVPDPNPLLLIYLTWW